MAKRRSKTRAQAPAKRSALAELAPWLIGGGVVAVGAWLLTRRAPAAPLPNIGASLIGAYGPDAPLAPPAQPAASRSVNARAPATPGATIDSAPVAPAGTYPRAIDPALTRQIQQGLYPLYGSACAMRPTGTWGYETDCAVYEFLRGSGPEAVATYTTNVNNISARALLDMISAGGQ